VPYSSVVRPIPLVAWNSGFDSVFSEVVGRGKGRTKTKGIEIDREIDRERHLVCWFSGELLQLLVQAKKRWCCATGKVTAGVADSNGSLPPGEWLKSHLRLTACTLGSAPGPTLGNECGKPLPFLLLKAGRGGQWMGMECNVSLMWKWKGWKGRRCIGMDRASPQYFS